MGSSIRLGRIWGIPVGINYSWIFVFLLFTYLLAGQFGHSYPQWPAPQRWSIALATSVLFFLSVLAHELSHSVVAVRKGIPVLGITLFIFGGVSQLAHEARRPFTEFQVAVVGPLSSVILGLVFGGLSYLAQGTSAPLSAICFTLFGINLSLGVFNLLPGFPLDGGRVLRAAVWGATGSYWRATQIATRAGQLIGALLVVGGVAWSVFEGVERLWMALIGGFLLVAATASYRQERARESLRSYRVGDIMTTAWQQVNGDTPLASPQVAQWLAGDSDCLVVLEGGRRTGILTRHRLGQLPRSVDPQTPVAAVMLPLSSLPALAPEEETYSALERIENEDLDRVAVLRNGELVGFVRREDALRLLRERGRPRL